LMIFAAFLTKLNAQPTVKYGAGRGKDISPPVPRGAAPTCRAPFVSI
jgi:hypothetical protein